MCVLTLLSPNSQKTRRRQIRTMSFRMYRLQYEQRTRLIPPDGGRRIEYARRSYFRRSLSRAPRYVCERGSRTLAGRHGKCAASHRPPPARLFASSDGTDSFCENVSEFFSHTFPKTIPQTSAGCSVLGIIRGYKLRTCPSDRAIGAQPDRCDQAAFFFSACFLEVFFLPTAARPCGAGYKHTVYSTSVAPTWRTAPGPWGPYGRRPHMQAAPGRAESPETASERPVTGLSAPIETMSNRLNVRTAQCQKSPNMSETAHIFIQLSLS